MRCGSSELEAAPSFHRGQTQRGKARCCRLQAVDMLVKHTTAPCVSLMFCYCCTGRAPSLLLLLLDQGRKHGPVKYLV